MKWMLSALVFLSAPSTGAIEVCDIEGVPTYTDRSDVCDGAGEAVDFDQGTFSLVEAPPAPEPRDVIEPAPQVVTVERIIERYVPVVIEVAPQPAIARGLRQRPFLTQGPGHLGPWRAAGHHRSLARPRSRGIIGIEEDDSASWPQSTQRSKPARPRGWRR